MDVSLSDAPKALDLANIRFQLMCVPVTPFTPSTQKRLLTADL